MKIDFRAVLLPIIFCVAIPAECFAGGAGALSDVNAPSAAYDTSSRIFDSDVKTLAVRNPRGFMEPPVLRLGSGDRLYVNFDIIGDSHEYLRCRLVHCNADWQPSQLLESEYIEGFNEWEVTDYAYSTNTFTRYVNYNVELPPPGVSLLVGGNYLLQVYPEDNRDEVLLQQRFYVSEDTLSVGGFASGRTDLGVNSEFQQLEIAADIAGGGNINPYQDLTVTVEQNNRPETLRVVRGPMRTDGQRIIYAHTPSLIFKAGNEYRRFETVRADNAGMNVDSVKFESGRWHVWLNMDEARADKEYVYDVTQHGRFKTDEYNAVDPDLGADYITVHFSLQHPEMDGADVYVDGDFTLHEKTDPYRMRYNRERGVYETEIALKQGSYNYQYVVASDDESAGPSAIEGDKYETGNEYLVCVYLRCPGWRSDRLAGVAVIR